MNKLTGDIHFNDKQFFFFCEFCEKDRALTDEDECEKCGRSFVHGMEEEELLTILKNYRELIKALASALYRTECFNEFEEGWEQVEIIHDAGLGNKYNEEDAKQALIEIVNRLKDDE